MHFQDVFRHAFCRLADDHLVERLLICACINGYFASESWSSHCFGGGDLIFLTLSLTITLGLVIGNKETKEQT